MTGKIPEFHLEQFLPYLVHRVGSRLAEGFEDSLDQAGLSLQEWYRCRCCMISAPRQWATLRAAPISTHRP